MYLIGHNDGLCLRPDVVHADAQLLQQWRLVLIVLLICHAHGVRREAVAYGVLIVLLLGRGPRGGWVVVPGVRAREVVIRAVAAVVGEAPAIVIVLGGPVKELYILRILGVGLRDGGHRTEGWCRRGRGCAASRIN